MKSKTFFKKYPKRGRNESWICPKCRKRNAFFRLKCRNCRTPKPLCLYKHAYND